MDVIEEIRADHERYEEHGKLICADCENPWPCPSERGAREIERLRAALNDAADIADNVAMHHLADHIRAALGDEQQA